MLCEKCELELQTRKNRRFCELGPVVLKKISSWYSEQKGDIYKYRYMYRLSYGTCSQIEVRSESTNIEKYRLVADSRRARYGAQHAPSISAPQA